MYADDVLLYIFSDLGLMDDCVARINEDLANILSWANSNKLQLNPTKTLSMVCSRREVNLMDFPNIVLNAQNIDYVSKVKYLGFQINNKLSCCDAISETIRRIYSGLRSLRFCSHFLNMELKKQLVKSLIMPYFTFNCAVYPCLDYDCKNKLNVAFNDCLRFIHNINRYESVSFLHDSLLGVNLNKYILYRNVSLLHKIIHGRCPGYLEEMLHFARSRRGLILILPRFTHTIAERSFFISVVRTWNSLPFDIQRSSSQASFRNKIFSHYCKFLFSGE